MEAQILTDNKAVDQDALLQTLQVACKKIAPVWPLENFVAVNPYLGITDQKFDSAAQYLAAVGGIQMTLPTSFYVEKINAGEITREDLAAALFNKSESFTNIDLFIAIVKNAEDQKVLVPTIKTLADVATKVTQKDWSRLVTARVSTWAASHFDHHQASWNAADQQSNLFASWKAAASVDRTSEISGLKGFRKVVKQLPDNALEAAEHAIEILGLEKNHLPLYLHRLLLSVGGWSSYAARLDWDCELYGGKDGKLIEFLAVLLCWEAGLYTCLESAELSNKWRQAKYTIAETEPQTLQNDRVAQKLVLQEAFDIAAQRKLIQKFQNNKPTVKEDKVAKAQAIFCIDVRSEVYRRNLELVDSEIETLGFAGFFAFPINYIPIAHAHGEAQCPVLIKTGPSIMETTSNEKDQVSAFESRKLNSQVSQVWKSFKSGAVTCFSFVSPIGLSYLPKLFTDSFGLTRPVPHPDQSGLNKAFSENKTISLEVAEHNGITVGIPLEQRVLMAKNALNAMSLTEKFAQFVLIVGHGSSTVNNPHATGLDCGACGGHTGESNSRVAAAVLNDAQVRKHLNAEGLTIPKNTVFLACLHDTTTDEVSIYNQADVPTESTKDLEALKLSLSKAGHTARTERALRMKTTVNVDAAIKARSKDWSQTRPEWGLAGCSAFVVAPRERTKNIDFGGQSFLHSYQWQKDSGFGILELIMTAPMVVTSWINLQYYGSSVDNKKFGSGNKTLHNVTAGVGVLEGFSGDLRVGLPMQSVHDGEKYQHEPLKLNVIIEAPIDAMNAILEKHKNVRDLCDNEWITLHAMNENGQVSHKYAGNLKWSEIEVAAVA
jgi:uncharacterized protein YbcC (UPF0753/DUF2309 family)